MYREEDDPLAKLSDVDKSEDKGESLCQALAGLGWHCSQPATLVGMVAEGGVAEQAQRCSAALMNMVVLLDPFVGASRCEVLMTMWVWSETSGFHTSFLEMWPLGRLQVRPGLPQELDFDTEPGSADFQLACVGATPCWCDSAGG